MPMPSDSTRAAPLGNRRGVAQASPMRDLFFLGFLACFLLGGFKRPFIFVLAYAYIDIVAPQRLSYFLLNAVPVSLIVFALAMLGYLLADQEKTHSRFAPRQWLLVILLGYCAYTTSTADFPLAAQDKWGWVWKALIFAIFLPLTLHKKLRIEALALIMVLCAASIAITGGIKTLASGGGYGVLQLLLDDNSGLYEGSIMSCIAIAIIPLILWLMKHGTIFPPDWRVKIFGAGLIFACLLIPVGTQARTGLVCIAVLVPLLLRFAKYRFVYAGLTVLVAIVTIPFLPQSFTQRMGTITDYKAEQSASTRVAVWAWTWEYAKDNPLGGGFNAFLQNKITVDMVETSENDSITSVDVTQAEEIGRAYHSSYFEMLGEQGFFGLAIWLAIHVGGLIRMEMVRRRYSHTINPGEQWIAPLATALQNGQIIYLVGSLFVGIAFQPFIYMLIATQIGLDTYLARRRAEAAWRPIRKVRTVPAKA